MQIISLKNRKYLVLSFAGFLLTACQDNSQNQRTEQRIAENEHFQSKVILLQETPVDCEALPEWSSTQPAINQQHVFCGEINSRQRATGYHARPAGADPINARVTQLKQAANAMGIYTAEIEVRQSQDSPWKSKFSSFFPDELNQEAVIAAIVHAFENSQKKNKWEGDSGLGFKIEGYLLDRGDHKGSINTAYPIYVGNQP